MELFSEIEAGAAEVKAIIRGLYTVARVDGLHEGEVQFISDLLRGRLDQFSPDDVAADLPASWAGLGSIEPQVLATLLPTSAQRELFLRAAYLLAWADGKVSFAERASIDAFAAGLGVSADALARCESEVKGHLLRKRSKRSASTDVSSLRSR